MTAALDQVNGAVILGGNLDPSAVFASGSVENVIQQTQDLLSATSQYPNYFVSSGCEIPPNANAELIDICSQTVKANNSRM